MERMKLVIAEGTEEFRMALVEALRGAYRVRACADGNEALSLICSFKPDLVILDLMLPGLDGISILERAVASGVRPMVLATSRFISDYSLEQAALLGVCYVMKKPCDLRATVARLTDLSQRIHPSVAARPDPRVHISNLLISLGVATKWKGYRCLLEAVLLMTGDRDQSITKELYPAVARLCGGDSQSVERTCRSAIEKAWMTRDERLWRLYFADDGTGSARRPTNAAFITRLADTVGMEEDEEN